MKAGLIYCIVTCLFMLETIFGWPLVLESLLKIEICILGTEQNVFDLSTILLSLYG